MLWSHFEARLNGGMKYSCGGRSLANVIRVREIRWVVTILHTSALPVAKKVGLPGRIVAVLDRVYVGGDVPWRLQIQKSVRKKKRQ